MDEHGDEHPEGYFAGDDEAEEDEHDYEDGEEEEEEHSFEEPEPPAPKGNASRPKVKGKGKKGSPDDGNGKSKAASSAEPWPPILEVLVKPQSVPDEVILVFLDELGCNDQTAMDVFEALSAADIAEAINSQAVKDVSSPLHRAILFKLCKEVATL